MVPLAIDHTGDDVPYLTHASVDGTALSKVPWDIVTLHASDIVIVPLDFLPELFEKLSESRKRGGGTHFKPLSVVSVRILSQEDGGSVSYGLFLSFLKQLHRLLLPAKEGHAEGVKRVE